MYKYTKNLIDTILALLALAILCPIIIIVLLLLLIVNRGNPFFLQKRPGLNEKPFFIIKFKTMNDCKNSYGLLPDEQRLTPIGKLIRKTSIDELPQLINVLKGDMSLVGPRPLLMEYLPLYNEDQKRRHHVRPGITGWAQVNGRNAISWEDKFKRDVWYVDNMSLMLDIKILWLTLIKVFRSEGVNEQGHVTTEKFKGNVQ